jgi:hypothetical protein
MPIFFAQLQAALLETLCGHVNQARASDWRVLLFVLVASGLF